MANNNRSIICEECKEPRRTQLSFDVCPGCVAKLPRSSCAGCGKLRYKVDPESGLCRRCTSKQKPRIVCAGCGAYGHAYTHSTVYCRRCYSTAHRRDWKKSLPREAVCVGCGGIKPTCLKAEMICQACYNIRRNGEAECAVAGCENLISNKEWQLCKHHYADRIAPAGLKRYLESYDSPFPQNKRYLTELASRIDWLAVEKGLAEVREIDVRRYRAVGAFLKRHELPEPLTWRAIDAALPPLGPTGRYRTKLIRSCLIDLGHLLAERGLMEDWYSYLSERHCDQTFEKAPEIFLDYLRGFQRWALGAMVNPELQLPVEVMDLLPNKLESLSKSVAAVIAFLSWCAGRGVRSLAEVSPVLVAEYQQTLFWQLECKACHRLAPLEPWRKVERCADEKCGAVGSCVRVKRHARQYVNTQTSSLRVFFDWAKLHGVLEVNPVAHEMCRIRSRTFTVVGCDGEVTEVERVIRRYDDRVVEKLCAYIVSPDADPEEALVLYLIIFHLCTVAELRNAKVPSLMKEESDPAVTASAAADYEYLFVPQREFTRGNRSVRRPTSTIKFPQKALPWLAPVLRRYYEKREEVVRAEHHEYLLAGEGRSRHNKPVCKAYVSRLVRTASLRALGGAVNPWDLRRTAAAVFAQRSKRRGAILTRMGYSEVRATHFNYLETFILRPKPIASAAECRVGYEGGV
jgi:hypothetical protein